MRLPSKIFTVLGMIFCFSLNVFAQDLPAYRLFNSKGKEVEFSEMVKVLNKSELVFFGESHNNPIAHWMELQLTKAVFEETGDKLVLGAEMFESDDQLILNEYLNDEISERNFKEEAKLWNNYSTDYKPIVEFAKTNNIPFIATNIPRRYASMVFKKGIESLDGLSKEAKGYIAPLPLEIDLELPGYKNLMTGVGEHSMPGNENFPKAQAIKDATMAYFVLKNWKPSNIFIHFNGSYHSNNFEGIVWYIKQKNPDINLKTITTVSQDSLEKLEEEHIGTADFILCVPSDMTTTY